MKKIFNFSNIDNFIIFGGGELIIDICQFLIKNKKSVILISTQKQINQNFFSIRGSLKKFLIKKKIKFLVFKNLKNHSKWKYLINKRTVGISHSSKWIFTEKEINFFDNRLLNIHYSNLPSFRGAGGLTWNILTQNFYSGTTVHFVDKKIDSGSAIVNKTFSFPIDIRNSLNKMQKFSLEIQKKTILNFMKKIIDKKSFQIKKIQHKSNSFYWPRLNTKKNAWIDWSWDTNEIINFINAFSYPYEGASTYFKGKIIRIHKAKIINEKIDFHPFQYGLIYKVLNNKVFIATKNKGIVIDLEYLNAKKGLLGKRLNTPKIRLEKSLEIFKDK